VQQVLTWNASMLEAVVPQPPLIGVHTSAGLSQLIRHAAIMNVGSGAHCASFASDEAKHRVTGCMHLPT